MGRFATVDSQTRIWPLFLVLGLLGVMADSAWSQVVPLAEERPPRIGNVVSEDYPQNSLVFAIGQAPIFGGDVTSARRIALQAAYAEAVAQGTGVSVGSLTIIRNVQQVSDLVTARSRGIVRSYEVINESIEQLGDQPVLTISIEADVISEASSDREELEALILFLEVLGQPRILVIAPQYDAIMGQPDGLQPSESPHISYLGPDGESLQIRHAGESRSREASRDYAGSPRAEVPSGVLRGTEAALAQHLSNLGYRTTTLDMLVGRIAPDLLSRARQGNTVAALDVARQVGAAVVLSGSFTVAGRRINPHGVEFEQVTVEYASRALLASNGEDVRTFHRSTTVAHSNMLAAMNEATTRIAAEVADEVAWRIPQVLANSPHILTIELDGVDFHQALAASETLNSLDGVLESRLTRLPADDGSAAVIELRTGFVRVPSAQVFQTLQAQMPSPLQILRSDEFHLLLSARG